MGTALSDLERIKASSRFLRGTIAAGLADPVTGAISEDDNKLLKFHGSYQQDDRDLREERRRQKLEPAYSFMIRARLPGGVIAPAQWLAFDAIARDFANGTLRITTRQTFQWHGVRKRHLKPAIAAINHAMASTIAACGDVNRNVVCSANPLQSAIHAEVYDWAVRLSDHLLPRTRGYGEIWLDDKQILDTEEKEPLYGPTYLPRKFKIGLAVPPVNDIDVFAQDLGFVAIVENGALAGFNVAVGGGMGATHGDATTYPRLGDVIGFVRPEFLLKLAENAIAIQRDWGDRSERKHARLKYTLDRRGVDVFVAELARRNGFALEPARPFAFEHSGDRYGWIEGENGRWHLTLHIEAGRLADTPQRNLLSGLREIARIHTGGFRLTCNQNLIVADVAAEDRAAIEALVAKHGLDGYLRQSGIRRHALACVALPTCGLAMAESERYLPDVLPKLEALLDRHGLLDAPILLRLSGCPNGCSRPYLGEIALVGKAPGRYNLMLGADHRGQRLNRLYRENVDEAGILAALEPLFARYAAERDTDERFGDFLIRSGTLAAPRSIPVEVTRMNPPDLLSAAEDARALGELNAWLGRQSAADRVAWALETTPGEHVLSSSFGAQSAAMLHLVTRERRDIPVILVDTGYLFPETYRFADTLAERLGLNLNVYRPKLGIAWMEARHGRLWEQGLDGIDRYNRLRKVEPMQRALDELGARTWFAGLRRAQANSRAQTDFVELRNGRWKVHPIADWSDRDIGEYLQRHGLPYHPLWDAGYISIGDVHTTRSLADAGDADATRFFGLKRECGLHVEV